MASIFKNVRTEAFRSRLVVGIYLCLGVLTWCVFGRTVEHNFVQYDDPGYVYENPDIAGGITTHSIVAAFTKTHARNWHPLTTVSHMLDCEWFGLDPAGHHLVNVLLHTITALLLFTALNAMTNAMWPSAFVAAVFAIHPLRVESVAWIAERKDVLSGVFFMLTLIAYAAYTRKRSLGRYLTMSIFLACGLMSKPMLITTPLILLLLDYWPLKRFEGSTVSKLLIEKVPLFALSIGSCVATLWAQNFALGSTEFLPLTWRITNAIFSYFEYVRQMFWPVDLIPFYVHPEGRVEMWRFLFAVIILVAVTSITWIRRRKNPYLVVGWFWYLIMLIPVIGIVQVGLQGHADRYTYLPQIGLDVALVRLIWDLTKSWRQQKIFLSGVGVTVVGTLSILSWKQTMHWRDTEALWRHTLAV